jgi:hypothetical protein
MSLRFISKGDNFSREANLSFTYSCLRLKLLCPIEIKEFYINVTEEDKVEKLLAMYELMSGKEFSVPLWEGLLFISVTTLCLLLGRHKLGLLTSYSFVFYWGFLSNLESFNGVIGSPAWGMSLYVFSGFLMFVVALVGFFVQGRD